MKEELLSMVPSDWRPKNEYPTLKGRAKILSYDLETYDPNLEENGPGALRKDGYVIGFSIATDDGFAGYYPIRHPMDNVENPEAAIRWIKDQLSDDTPKVGANLLYDAIWSKCDLGFDIKGLKYDIQVAEPLIDENQDNFRLDTLGVKYLNEHKKETLLLEAGKLLLGIKPKALKKKKKDGEVEKGLSKEEAEESIIKQVKQELWRLPARYVGPYGIGDADMPIRIFKKQKAILEKEGLWDLFLIETEVLEILYKMWIKGVPVNIPKAEKVAAQLQAELEETNRMIRHRCGFDVDIWSADSIAKACDTLGIQYLRTDKGNPSFTAEWLKSQDNKFLNLVAEARSLDRSGSVFIQKKLIDLAVNGRIHPQFWQVKNDKGGTGSGRFASSNPNAQQFPARNERMARLVRGLIEPEENCKWGIFDYNQQEPRVTVHYGYICKLAGAEEARQRFIDDPKTDYHQMTADIADIERKPAKTINLGLTYGMGENKLASELGLSLSEARLLFRKYHSALPYIKELMQYASKLAGKRGYVKTLLGRRKHFDLFGPPRWSKGIVPKKFDEAVKEFGMPVQRYFLHKALNSIIQGSSADMIKVAMVLCYRAGYIPHLTIHDENDYSIENLKQAKEIHDIMVHETAKYLKLTVPLRVDVEIGDNWGECELVEF